MCRQVRVFTCHGEGRISARTCLQMNKFAGVSHSWHVEDSDHTVFVSSQSL